MVVDKPAGGSGEPVELVQVFQMGSLGEESGGGFGSDAPDARDIIRFIPGQGAVVAPLMRQHPVFVVHLGRAYTAMISASLGIQN
jgi:hypothetical protein